MMPKSDTSSISIETGRYGLVQFMIEKGADVNAGSNDQQTALKIAEGKSQFLITGLLLRAGAKK